MVSIEKEDTQTGTSPEVPACLSSGQTVSPFWTDKNVYEKFSIFGVITKNIFLANHLLDMAEV